MDNKENTKKGKVIGLTVGIITFVLTFYGVQQFFMKDLESELKMAAVELNKLTPMEIDEYVRLDSASSKGKTNFIYYNTLYSYEKSEVKVDTVTKYVKPGLVENIKNSSELKVYRDNHITMDYIFYDKYGYYVTKISVTPDLYK